MGVGSESALEGERSVCLPGGGERELPQGSSPNEGGFRVCAEGTGTCFFVARADRMRGEGNDGQILLPPVEELSVSR